MEKSSWNIDNVIEAVSVDNVIFGFENGKLMVLLYQHAFDPFKGKWALPGGHVRYTESVDVAAKRMLKEFTGIDQLFAKQLKAFGDVDRVKSHRTITIVYYALVRPDKFSLKPGADAQATAWFEVNNVPKLILDHNLLLKEALQGLRRQVKYEPIGFELLPKKFSLLQLQELYEAIYDQKFDKPNFRRKILNMGLLVKLDEKQTKVSHRFATLYKFDNNIYKSLIKEGLYFEI